MSDLENQESEFTRLLQRAPFDDQPALEHRQALHARVMAEFDREVGPPMTRPAWQLAFMKGQEIMRRPASRLLVSAASLAIAAVWLFVPGGQTTAQAFNRFAAAVVAAKTAHFQMEVRVGGLPIQQFQTWYLAPGRYRQETGTTINISDMSAGKIVSIIPAEKKVVVMTFKGAPKDKISANYFERLRELLADNRKAKEAQYELLGEKEIEGKPVVGFRYDSSAEMVTMWGDPATGQPVRIESVFKGVPRTEVAMADFEFNVELKESMFDVSPPAEYKIQSFDVDTSESREQDLVKAFQSCSEIGGGEFPATLDMAGVTQLITKFAMRRVKDGTEFSDDDFQGLMKQSIAIGRGFQFTLTLPESADAHYAGKGVKRDEKNRAIFWYRPQDLKTYRVIHADLTVNDSETAPQIEGAKRIQKAGPSNKASDK
ncbi:MAG TPA: hypothetical protein VGM05_14655 [Planctomycetaceae bacterium]|jgi:outer membrane lipoprotein-sorting protein